MISRAVGGYPAFDSWFQVVNSIWPLGDKETFPFKVKPDKLVCTDSGK